MTISFQVATGVPTPIYRQIVDQVNLGVAGGVLKTGDRMPSVRAVAEELLINPNTVARAYTDLVRAGVLETQPGKGIFVAQRRQRFSEAERAERLQRASQQFINEVALLGYSKHELLDHLSGLLSKLHKSDGASQFAPTDIHSIPHMPDMQTQEANPNE